MTAAAQLVHYAFGGLDAAFDMIYRIAHAAYRQLLVEHFEFGLHFAYGAAVERHMPAEAFERFYDDGRILVFAERVGEQAAHVFRVRGQSVAFFGHVILLIFIRIRRVRAVRR